MLSGPEGAPIAGCPLTAGDLIYPCSAQRANRHAEWHMHHRWGPAVSGRSEHNIYTSESRNSFGPACTPSSAFPSAATKATPVQVCCVEALRALSARVDKNATLVSPHAALLA